MLCLEKVKLRVREGDPWDVELKAAKICKAKLLTGSITYDLSKLSVYTNVNIITIDLFYWTNFWNNSFIVLRFICVFERPLSPFDQFDFTNPGCLEFNIWRISSSDSKFDLFKAWHVWSLTDLIVKFNIGRKKGKIATFVNFRGKIAPQWKLPG